MTMRILAAIPMLALTCACASSGPKAAADAAPVDFARADGADIGLRPIPNAALPSGACGMVMWTLEGNRPAAIFQFISGKKARINIAGRPVELTLADYGGASGFGVYERQTFEGGEGIEVEVNARFGLSFNGGSYLEQGLVKVRDSAGWSIVAPAAGVAGCR